MADRIIEVETSEGTAKFVVEDRRLGPERVGRRQNAVAALGQSLDDALSFARPAAQAVVDAFQDAGPDEVELEFGLEVDAEAGIVFAKSGAKAHFKVTLKWTA